MQIEFWTDHKTSNLWYTTDFNISIVSDKMIYTYSSGFWTNRGVFSAYLATDAKTPSKLFNWEF